MTTKKKITLAMKRDLIGTSPAPKSLKRTVGNGLTATGNLARPKQGGRQAGSKNKKQVSEEMLEGILQTFQALGGVRWLTDWAKKNETDFVKIALARLFPTPYQEPTDAPPVSINILNERDPNYLRQAALQIAFALETGVRGDPGLTIEAEPVTPDPPPAPPPPYQPEASAPIESFESLQEIAERAAARELVADTIRCDLGNYPGSSGEQGLAKKKRS